MKTRILSLFLALTLCVGLAVPTLAAEDGIIPLPEWTNGFGQHYFHNGLAPVLTSNGWNYVNTKGELMPDHYHHTYVFDYSEGYAAFADIVDDDFTIKVGYMDVNGKVVVPAKYDLWDYGLGDVSVGRVIDGQALVYDASTGEWTQINMRGQKVKRTLNPDDENVFYSDYIGNTDDVTFETATINGEEMELGFSEGYALSYEYIVKQGYAPKEDLAIYFDERTVSAIDNGVSYRYTLTNNTEETITGYYALLSYKPEYETYFMSAQFHVLNLTIAPGETISGSLTSNYYDLSQSKMCWLEFDSEAERDNFFADNAFYDYGDHYLVHGSEDHNVAWLESKLGTSLAR